MLLTLLADTPATVPQPNQGLPPEDSADGIIHLFQVVGDFYNKGIDDHLIVAALLLVIIIDILLGTSCAWAHHEYKSYIFRRGLVSHVTMFTLTAILYPLFVFAGLSEGADSFILAMIFAYVSSILANLARLGVHIPYIDSFVRNNIDSHKFELTSSDTPEDVQRKLGHPERKKRKRKRKRKDRSGGNQNEVRQ